MPEKGRKTEEYARRRSFDKTPEPAGGSTASDASSRFVVQEHHARRLHWDLRLEHDGVLVSWALPRGFPDDPEENRLAVHTEDHPVEYLEFEGQIPAGEYGAGSMTIWDSGSYTAEKFQDDKVVVRLEGEQVHGRYALFRTRDSDWLIHRMDPPERDRAPMPAGIVPMMATLSELPSESDQWAFEIKWDGVRAICYGEPGQIRLESRNLLDITRQYPEIGGLSRDIGAHHIVLDGEITALDDEGRPSFQRLQRRMHVSSPGEVHRRQRDVPVTYVIFDLLYLDGRSLLGASYEQRRRHLDELDLAGSNWQVPDYQRGNGEALLRASSEHGLEGIIAKRLDSAYQPGRRGPDWRKIKNVRRQEFVIGGWVPGAGRRSGQVGALLVGYYENEGDEPRLRYAGKVGTGFDHAELRMLHRHLEPLRTESSPFAGRQPEKAAIFVRPDLVCDVDFSEWTRAGTIRHPSYQGLREDKPVTDVVRETPEVPTESTDEPAGGSWLMEGSVQVKGREIQFSNLDKVLYPAAGTTKRDVIEYYHAIADVLLPHLRGRPLTMKRYPDGVDGPHFYEKQCPSWRPDWVTTTSVWSERKAHDIDFCVIDDLPTLLWAANLADLELHTMLARREDLNHPTMLVFDLDPGEGVGLVQCARVGLWMREMLHDLELQVLVKSSGSKGLHLHVPLDTSVDYDETKQFAHAMATLVENVHPGDVVSRMTRSRRRGKVFVDWSQNTAHKTTVVPFSLRAGNRPTVAAPLSWQEVEALSSGAADPRDLRLEAAAVLEQLDHRAGLIAPLLDLEQRLPRFDR